MFEPVASTCLYRPLSFFLSLVLNGYKFSFSPFLSNSGHTECCKWLVANRAPLDVIDNMGRTPLDLAEEYQHTEVEEFLKSCRKELTRSDSSLSQLRSRYVYGFYLLMTRVLAKLILVPGRVIYM